MSTRNIQLIGTRTIIRLTMQAIIFAVDFLWTVSNENRSSNRAIQGISWRIAISSNGDPRLIYISHTHRARVSPQPFSWNLSLETPLTPLCSWLARRRSLPPLNFATKIVPCGSQTRPACMRPVSTSGRAEAGPQCYVQIFSSRLASTRGALNCPEFSRDPLSQPIRDSRGDSECCASRRRLGIQIVFPREPLELRYDCERRCLGMLLQWPSV